MTKKDYELIAEVLLKFETDEDTHSRLVEEFAKMLLQDNPRFDTMKFKIASGKV